MYVFTLIEDRAVDFVFCYFYLLLNAILQHEYNKKNE